MGISLAQGKTEQISIPAELVPLARAWISNYQRLWQRIEQISAINRELLRQRRVRPSQARPARRGRRGGGAA